ncbi:MAG: M61 family metallopeptidase, partial [Burkholderiaceae bacterium]
LINLYKHTFQAKSFTGVLVVRYRVHAWDPSVRAAHLDESHGFFNGSSVFLRVAGREDEPHAVELIAPRGNAYRDWRVATSLPVSKAKPTGSQRGFGNYRVDNYDALIDHPVEMGRFRLERFEAAGVPHEIAFTGHIPNLDAARITDDLAKLCAAQIRFFAAKKEAAPFDRYVFLVSVAGEGYGGLEHRASTALLCSRDSLPVEGQTDRTAGYRGFLGLASHEYFHAWNVKRIKPAAFARYDLERENYTSLLWIFEGFTSYYDDLFLVRTGLASEQQYLEMIAKVIDDVVAGGGRRIQSTAESSFDAWIKYYRQDENSPNAIVSYYKKGSLIALCLDLFIRAKSRGKASLDDVMRLMWRRHGRDFYARVGGTGIGEDDFPSLVAEATGIDVREEVAHWAYGTDDLPLVEELAAFGLALRSERRQQGPSLGARISAAVAGNECRITHVDDGGAAHRAGLAAGDVLVAIDDVHATPGRIDSLLSRYRAGDTVDVCFFRGDLLQKRELVLDAAPMHGVIEDAKKASKTALTMRKAWLTDTRVPRR